MVTRISKGMVGACCGSTRKIPNTKNQLLYALTRCECRIQHVNVDTDVYLRITDPIFELTDDSIHSNSVDVSGCHDFEATTDIVSQVSIPATQGCSDTCMDGDIADQAFFMSEMQKGSMVHSTLDPRITSGSLRRQTFPASLHTHSVIFPRLEAISQV